MKLILVNEPGKLKLLFHERCLFIEMRKTEQAGGDRKVQAVQEKKLPVCFLQTYHFKKWILT